MSWLRRHRFALLLALTYAWFFQGSDPNETTRFLMTRAIVDRGALDITPDHPLTIDKAEKDGRYYGDKAPAVSFLAVPAYAAMRIAERATGLDPDAVPVRRARFHALVVAVSGLSGVLAALMLRRALRLLEAQPRVASLVAFAYALGTLAFPFSTMLFGHQTAAAILITSFAVALAERACPSSRPRRVRAILGALWSLALVTEYTTALLVAALGLWFLAGEGTARRATRSFGWIVLGALPLLALHSLLMWRELGSPFDLAYRHVSEPIFRAHMTSGLLGIGRPRLEVLTAALVSPYRGLLFYCPVLALAVAGFGAWIARGARGREAILCAALIAIALLLTSGYYAWDGGHSVGPRHLVAVLPFFAIPIAWWAQSGRVGWWTTIAATIPSVAIMLACTAVLVQLPEGDPWRADPLYSVVVPSLARGELAINPSDAYQFLWRRDAAYDLGTLFGLGAWAALAVPVLAWVAAYARDLAPRRAA